MTLGVLAMVVVLGEGVIYQSGKGIRAAVLLMLAPARS